MRVTSLGKNGKGGCLKWGGGGWEIVGKGTQEDERSRGKGKHGGAKPGGATASFQKFCGSSPASLRLVPLLKIASWVHWGALDKCIAPATLERI